MAKLTGENNPVDSIDFFSWNIFILIKATVCLSIFQLMKCNVSKRRNIRSRCLKKKYLSSFTKSALFNFLMHANFILMICLKLCSIFHVYMKIRKFDIIAWVHNKENVWTIFGQVWQVISKLKGLTLVLKFYVTFQSCEIVNQRQVNW